MDKKLIYNDEVHKRIIKQFEDVSGKLPQIVFKLWEEIPNEYRVSYCRNEQLINPIDQTYEDWETSLLLRTNPIFSVAIHEGNVVSSVYGAKLPSEWLLIFWSTNENYRQREIGKGVLLHLLMYCLKNERALQIRAWDITSFQVEKFLTRIGFI